MSVRRQAAHSDFEAKGDEEETTRAKETDEDEMDQETQTNKLWGLGRFKLAMSAATGI